MKIKEHLSRVKKKDKYYIYIITYKNFYVAGRKEYDEIIEIYNECVNVNWDMDKLAEIKEEYKEKLKVKSPMRNILMNQSGYYEVFHKGKYFCCSPNKEEIIKYRDLLLKNNWDASCLPFTPRKNKKSGLPKYIRKSTNNTYAIQKDRQTWGTFKKLEDAVEERDLLIKYGWTYDFVDLY